MKSTTLSKYFQLLLLGAVSLSSLVLIKVHITLTSEIINQNTTSVLPDLVKRLSDSNRTLEKYFLVFAIPSKPEHVALRNIIRKTWSNISSWSGLLSDVDEKDKRIKLMFLFGGVHEQCDEFDKELELHSDDMFVVDNLREHRTALKYKIMWSMQQALYRYEFSYFIKTDDDIVVNLPLLIKELMERPREHFQSGNCYVPYGGFSGWPRWLGKLFQQIFKNQFTFLNKNIFDEPIFLKCNTVRS